MKVIFQPQREAFSHNYFLEHSVVQLCHFASCGFSFFPSDTTPVPNKSLVLLVIRLYFLYLNPRRHKHLVSPLQVHLLWR